MFIASSKNPTKKMKVPPSSKGNFIFISMGKRIKHSEKAIKKAKPPPRAVGDEWDERLFG